MKVAYIAGVCVAHDAISAAVRDEICWLRESGHEVILFAYACDYQELPFVLTDSETDIVFHPFFQQCDVAVFHFGVFYSLFNVLPVVRNGAKKVVVFHNITPKEFLPASSHALIDRSFSQLTNMAFADHIICDSQVNQTVLRENGVRTPSTVIPLPVHASLSAPSTKPSFSDGVIRILFLGRFVRSKGPTELLSALADLLKRESGLVVQLDMIGNLKFSDDRVLERMRELIDRMHADFGARLMVNIAGNASEAQKQEILRNADLFVLPTYHEGFCVPILEAIASGCLVVCYDNSNTPSVSGALARLVPTGDIAALEQSIGAEIETIASGAWKSAGYRDRVGASKRHLSAFAPDCVREQYLDFMERRLNRLC